MKKAILLLIICLSNLIFAQNFDKNWYKVIDLENEGKIATAYKEVKNIHQKTGNKHNEVQIIKCFFYESKYLMTLKENAQKEILDNLQLEMSTASEPTKALLNLVYAKCLESYYNKNQYHLSNRTTIETTNQGSFLTWNRAEFVKQIELAYEASLHSEEVLKNTPIERYDAVFDYINKDEFQKTSLYNYILSEGIAYYKTKCNLNEYYPKLSKHFLSKLIGSHNEFKSISLDTIKNEAVKKTLSLYQKGDYTEKASKLELNRMLFCNEYISHNDESLLLQLNQFEKRNNDTILKQFTQFEKAKLYEQLASKNKFPDYNTKAITVLDSILKTSKYTSIYKLSALKKQQIQQPNLNLNMLKYSYENENIRALIRYKNVDSVRLSFYKINSNQIINNYRKKDSIYASIASKNKLVKAQKYSLNNKHDYFEYSTQVELPQLETGLYLVKLDDLVGDSNSDYEVLQITNISVLAYQKGTNYFYKTLDRKTGKPIVNCEITNPIFNLKTDVNGVAEYEIKKDEIYNKEIAFINQKDTLYTENRYLHNFYDTLKEEEIKAKVDFYLDRAIYRPGQTVYYKGIATQEHRSKKSVISNLKLKITIEDDNSNEIKTFDVVTNEFGSFSGEFTLPANGLTGEFSMEAEEPDDYTTDPYYNKETEEHAIWDNGEYENSIINFKVEEYKRPKFQIQFEPIKESYIVNQKVSIKGKATSFSGSNITDAKVVYSIIRSTYSVNDGYKKESIVPITKEIHTDGLGNFLIEFIASPDLESDAKDRPVFTYQIKATITDSNGETHSSETAVEVGYHSLNLELKIPSKITSSENTKIYFNSTNLNNESKNVKGEVKIYFIKNFENKFKLLALEKPEIETISKELFNQLYPYENNADPVDIEDTGTLVFSKSINTEDTHFIETDFMNRYHSGYYKIVFSANDINSIVIERKKIFEFYQAKDKNANGNELLIMRQMNEDPVKDGFVKMQINSAVPDVYINCYGVYKNNLVFKEDVLLSKYQTEIKIPISKDFKNMFTIGIETVLDNQYYKFSSSIFLKDLSPKTKIEVNSFRDKLEPGQPESWSFTVKEENKTEAYEVLASMYDSSLDQFTVENWDLIHPNRFTVERFYGTTFIGFDTMYLSCYFDKYKSNPFIYDDRTQLIWFGFDFNNSRSNKNDKTYQYQLNKKEKKPSNALWTSGIVKDENGPAYGVKVMISGTHRTTYTDWNGYYEIEAAEGEKLIFSGIGFETKTADVNIDTLGYYKVGNNNSLDSVMISGAMGIRRKKDAQTSSQQMIKSYEIDGVSAQKNIIQALEGKVSGLEITTNSNSQTRIVLRGSRSISGDGQALVVIDGVISTTTVLNQLPPEIVDSVNVLKGTEGTALYGEQAANGVIIITTKKAILSQVKTRTHLEETAFFYPNLMTDAKGTITINFNSPESLTEWKFRLFAHNKKANSGYLERFVHTQKELMVFPNFPRFLREKDTIIITAKVSNMMPSVKKGMAQLQLFDVSSMKNIDVAMNNSNTIKAFTILPSGNTTVSWKITIPEGIQGVQYKIVAKSDQYSDGEESILPVLTNTILVTESQPIWVREKSSKEIHFDNLKNSTSTTLRNHLFNIEYCTNPTWLAIESLPYLMEYEHECAEQTFSRYYANAIASEIINSNPKFKAVIDSWKTQKQSVSKFERNEELKTLLLAETPWLIDAASEEEKKQKLALLFDLDKMKDSQEATLKKLTDKQKSSGGFVWFDGGNESEFITRTIVAGIGHLQMLYQNTGREDELDKITKKAIPYLDNLFAVNNSTNIRTASIHYLYARSFYIKSYPIAIPLLTKIDKQLEDIQNNWLSYSLYEKGLASLVLSRFGDPTNAKKILVNLKETAALNEDSGMYWIENKSGWNWYQAPIETQALLIEAFNEIDHDTKSVEAMKVWLLKNKQTKNWPSTKSTADAVYALLLQGSDWSSIKDNTVIQLGTTTISTKKLSENEKEADTGYMKLNWKADEINKDMGSIQIDNKSKATGFGGIYWQYFETLDKIKDNNDGMLSVTKELYLKKDTENGEKLTKITTTNPLKIGDLVTIRLIVVAKENIDYIHLKDMRASCFEPTSVLSDYHWENGLGYYQSTKDAATHFFFDQLNKGTYVLEYDVRVNNAGDFSNGISTIESMYAPELSSHTKGIKVSVK